MGFWELFKRKDDAIDINEAVERMNREEGAVLLDVREPFEYMVGHIPGARNLPVTRIQQAEYQAPNMAMPVFVYCKTGGRSTRAARILRSLGYRDVWNAGAIEGYKGPLVSGMEDNNDAEK